MLRGLLLATVLLVTGVLPASAANTDTDSVVRTESGVVEGVRSDEVVRYLGVPYAAPPVDELRWKAPRPAPAWAGVRQADEPGPPCAQGPSRPNASEDCLYVDVTVPTEDRDESKPVMVWLHGGGFSQGAGSEYDATRMAVQGDVIVVTVDFRLGIFGLFGHPGLAGSGTYGLLDQQAALRWVRQNIEAFGGDAGNVTLFGQSGGAVAACGQLTSPLATGLFDKAILQSGSCDFDWPKNGVQVGLGAGSLWSPVYDVTAAGTASTRTLNCERSTPAAELACLRRLRAHELDDEYAKFGTAATGTSVLPLDPVTALRIGLFHRVPVMSGSNHDEQRMVAGIQELLGAPITADNYGPLIQQAFGDRANQILRRYPLDHYDGDGALAWSSVYTDRMWACNQLDTSTALAARTPTYTYEFADPNAQPLVDLPPDFDAGASHGSELPNLFEVAGRRPIDSDRYTNAQRELASTMVDYWTTFARTGDPNTPNQPAWPRADAALGGQAGPTLRLAPGDSGIHPIDLTAEHRCAFWGS